MWYQTALVNASQVLKKADNGPTVYSTWITSGRALAPDTTFSKKRWQTVMIPGENNESVRHLLIRNGRWNGR